MRLRKPADTTPLDQLPATQLAAPELLHIEDRRGGRYLRARFAAIVAWRQDLSGPFSAEGLGVAVYLGNGDTVSFTQVGFAFLTQSLKEHYGRDFASTFIGNDPATVYVRRADIIGFSFQQRLHLKGGHQISGLQVTTADLSTVAPLRCQQPEDAVMPQPVLPRTRALPAYDEHGSFEVDQIATFEGLLYRRTRRGGNRGNPVQIPEDWEFVREI